MLGMTRFASTTAGGRPKPGCRGANILAREEGTPLIPGIAVASLAMLNKPSLARPPEVKSGPRSSVLECFGWDSPSWSILM